MYQTISIFTKQQNRIKRNFMISFTNHLDREFKALVLCKSKKNQMHDFRSLFLRSFLESANTRLIAVFKRHSEIACLCSKVHEAISHVTNMKGFRHQYKMHSLLFFYYSPLTFENLHSSPVSLECSQNT